MRGGKAGFAAFVALSVAPLSCLVVNVMQIAQGVANAKHGHDGLQSDTNADDTIPIRISHPCFRSARTDFLQFPKRGRKMACAQTWVIRKRALRQFQLMNDGVGFQVRRM